MSAVSRSVSLTALVALLGVAVAGEVKGPVHISQQGVTHFNGDTARFKAAMDADARGEIELAVYDNGHARRLTDEGREVARRVAREGREMAERTAREGREIAERMARESREIARRVADDAREAAREAAREGREAAREHRDVARRVAREARVHVAHAMAAADEAMRDARRGLAEARREITERRRELDERRSELDENHEDRWDNAIEIRDGRIVRCSDPAKYPGTGCAPFSPEEKARVEAQVHAAREQARAAMAKAEAGLREAERALNAQTSP